MSQNRIQILPSSIDTLIKRAGRYTISIDSGELAGEKNFTITPAKPDHIATELVPILLKDKTQTLTLKVVDIYDNSILPTNWDMKMTSSLPLTFSGFSTPSREFQ